jgi:Type I restriction enzyme HindI endonuclease subunit-like, C-terminal
LNAVSFVSDEIAEAAKRFRLSAGDLLIGMTGDVGEVGLVPPIRVIVRRILRKYGYAPDKQDQAAQTVLEQAKLLCAEMAGQC